MAGTRISDGTPSSISGAEKVPIGTGSGKTTTTTQAIADLSRISTLNGLGTNWATALGASLGSGWTTALNTTYSSTSTTTNPLTVDNSTLQYNTGTTFDGSAARTISAKMIPLSKGGTGVDLSATGGANQFLKQTSVGGNVSVAKLTRADVTNTFTPVGTVFTESWANLTAWTNVGTPGASVTGGQLSFSGTASTSTNYIKNNSYGTNAKFNLESASISWTETVGTIGASTDGIAFALQSAANLGSTYQNSIMVSVNLTNSSTGAIKWYSASTGGAYSLVQTSAVQLVPVAGNVLNITLTLYADKYQLSYNINGAGKTASDTFIAYFGPVGGGVSGYNAANFAFYNIGGGSSHSVGAITIKSLHNINTDYLFIGNSILYGAGPAYLYNRISTYVQKRTYATIELNARPSNSVNDVNLSEISSYNATNIVLMAASNDITVNGATTAGTDLATLITGLGTIVNTAAPSGYSTANGNLFICTEIPRTGIAAIATYNTNAFSTYPFSKIINFNGVLSDGTNTLPTFAGNANNVYTMDGIHPMDFANSLLADEFIRFMALPKKDVYQNEDFQVNYIPGSPNTFLGNTNGVSLVTVPSTQNKFLALGAAAISTNISTVRPMATQAVWIGQDANNGFQIFTDKTLTIGTNYNKTLRFQIDYFGGATITQGVEASSWTPTLIVTPGAHTGQTTAVEFPNFRFDGATQTAASGTTALQRNFYIKATTYAGTSGTRTLSDAFGLFVEKSLTTGGSIVITRNWGIGTDGNLQVQGSTYHGAATTTPTALVHIAAGTATANTSPLKFTAPAALLATPEALTIEPAINGDYLNLTTTTGTVRRVLVAGSSGRATAQTAANNSVATYTLGATDATYEVSANVLVTTSSAENFTVTVSYTDEGNTARVLTLNFQTIAAVIGTGINFSNGAVPYEGLITHIRCKASTSITIKTTGTFTGATYNVEGIIKQTN